jgi:hypothetical protein
MDVRRRAWRHRQRRCAAPHWRCCAVHCAAAPRTSAASPSPAPPRGGRLAARRRRARWYTRSPCGWRRC